MQINVEKQGKLGRQITVEIPAAEFSDAYCKRLKKIATTVRVDGFRKGKVPAKIVEQRYGEAVTEEVADDLMHKNFYQAIVDKKLQPAGVPQLEVITAANGQPFKFNATFEVFPEISLKPFSKLKFEKTVAEIKEADVNKTIDAIRKQHAQWQPVERKAADGDKVLIDFSGKVDGEPLPNGDATDFELELGSHSMIPGFEEEMIGHKAGDQFVIKPKFPKEYHVKELAGKKAEFAITLKEVQAAQLPVLDDAFAEKLGLKEKGVEGLRTEVRANMQRELDNILRNENKRLALDCLYEANDIDLPNVLIDNEIQHMKEDFMQHFGGKIDINTLMNKSTEDLEGQAKRRVALGLLLSEVIKTNEIKVDADRVRLEIEKMAAAYESPEQVVKYYYSDKKHLQQIEGLVLEDQVIEKITAEAKVVEKTKSFDEMMKRN